jgi:TonB family protein
MSWLSIVATTAVQAMPVVTVPAAPATPDPAVRPAIVEYSPGAVRCGEHVVMPLFAATPLPASTVAGSRMDSSAFTVGFAISPDGRPHAIAEPRTVSVTSVGTTAMDLPAALAAWRFPVGAERSDCSATFTATVTRVEDATPAKLYAFAALPKVSQFAFREIVDRAKTVGGGNCFTGPRPATLLEGHPDYDRIPQRSGTLSWTMVGFDIDAQGRPVRTRTLASDGNAALDRAAIAATKRSRWAAGQSRTGCTQPHFRRQNVPLVAPPPPPTQPATTAAGCSPEAVLLAANFTYPEAFQRRAVEGWAIIRYDVAPWGATGNVSIVAAEPAARFGDSAMLGVLRSKLPATSTGASGCIVRVKFAMPAEGDPASVIAP